MSALREELHSILASMDDNQVKQVLQIVKNMNDDLSMLSDTSPEAIDDPTIGFIKDAPADWAERSEDILQELLLRKNEE